MGFENSGRRPQPTAIKLLRGNPGLRKTNQHEPVPPKGAVEKPEWLEESAGAVWDRVAPICLQMRTLTVADVDAFVSFCRLQATMQTVAASKDGRQLFSLEVQDPQRENSPMEIVIDAALRLERETAVALRPYYELFGLTPSARARLVVPSDGKKQDESKWAGALK